MKLILKQYLLSLRERNELDAVLPNLLSEIGFNVYTLPMRGANEYGVDIAATGLDGDGIEKVFLFSVKSGNLTRRTWHGDSPQDLRPSLDSILDSYIPSRIPPQHQDKQIVICMCFGGDVKTNVRQDVSGYTSRNSCEKISFQEWNGDKLAELILEYLFNEALLPDNLQSTLRKSLAFVDEPEIAFNHFARLIHQIIEIPEGSLKQKRQIINRINLCLWVFFSWCRDDENLEAAYLAAEFSLVKAWELVKEERSGILSDYDSVLETYHLITEAFLDKCIIPFVDKQFAITHGTASGDALAANLKLFDLLSRLAIKGHWLLFKLEREYLDMSADGIENETQNKIRLKLEQIIESIKLFIKNNPLLLSPFQDEQAIDIVLVLSLLIHCSENDEYISSLLDEMIHRIIFSFYIQRNYPTNLRSYEELLEYRNTEYKGEDDYLEQREKVTIGSILYPMLSLFGTMFDCAARVEELEEYIIEKLPHCTLQYWYPDEASEQHLYLNKKNHGLAAEGFKITPNLIVQHFYNESNELSYFESLSCVDKGYRPLVLVACRLYRHPVPISYIKDYLQFYIQSQQEAVSE